MVSVCIQGSLTYFNFSPPIVAPMDYTALSEVLMFAACERRQCADIIIEDDGIPEQVESFFVTLQRSPGQDVRISLEPVDGEIEILDANSMYESSAICVFVVHCILLPSGCGGSGEDILQCVRRCGCGRGVCHCVQPQW